MSAKHTQGRLEAFDNAGRTMQSYSQSSGLHGVGDNRLKLIAGCFKDIGGEDVAAANARRLAACWNSYVGVSTDDIEAMGGVTLFKGKPVGELAAARALLEEVIVEVPADYSDELTERIRAFLKGQP